MVATRCSIEASETYKCRSSVLPSEAQHCHGLMLLPPYMTMLPESRERKFHSRPLLLHLSEASNMSGDMDLTCDSLEGVGLIGDKQCWPDDVDGFNSARKRPKTSFLKTISKPINLYNSFIHLLLIFILGILMSRPSPSTQPHAGVRETSWCES